MKKYILLLLSLLFLQCSSGKVTELYKVYNPNDYLYWSEELPLTWNDFQGEPIGSAEKYGSEIHIYNPATIEKANLFSPAKLTTICVFDKKHSWVNRDVVNDTLLLYNQVIFDIYELYTRKLRQTFAENDFGINDFTEKFHSMTEKNNNALTEEVDLFRKQSDMGQFAPAVYKWSARIRNEIHNLDDFREDKQ